VADAARAFQGNLISLAITWLDRKTEPNERSLPGDFSHAGLSRDGLMRDAAQREPTTVATYNLDVLAEKGREFVAYSYKGGDAAVRAAFDAHEWPGIPAPEPDFAMEGMLRIGIILLTVRSSWAGRWIGRALVRWASRDDPDGLFCTEFVAKSFVKADAELKVRIDSRRVPPLRVAPEEAWRRVINDRLQAAGGAVAAQVEEEIQKLRELDNLIGDQEVVLQVGTQFPAWLVTPNDLASSPSLEPRRDPQVPGAVSD
jgi:hypothetical protein